MLLFLLKASIVIIVLLAFYKLFLEKESFFATNRIYLLSCLFLALALPFLVLPKLINEQGVVDRYMAQHLTLKESSTVEVSSTLEPSATNNFELDLATNRQQAEYGTLNLKNKNWLHWLMILYLFGVAILGFNLLAQMTNLLLKIWRNPDKIVDTTGTIVNMTDQTEPCSFFNYIFINPEKYDYETYNHILAHEQIHVQQRHTLDLLLSELAVVFLWFNPFVWKLRKEVEKNIEYQTDHLLLQQEGIEAEHYQMNLLKVATLNKPLTITTNYNQSLLKNRILKMTSQKSNPYNIWKYAFVAPLVFMTLLLINQPEATATAAISGTLPSDNIADPPSNQGEAMNNELLADLEAPDDPRPATPPEEEQHMTSTSTSTTTTLTEDNIDLRDTAKLDVLKDLAALGDEEAQEMLSELSDIKFYIKFENLPDLPDKNFRVSFDGLDLEERLEVMKCLNTYYSLDPEKQEEVYHVFLKYDLDKPDVLKVLQGRLSRKDMNGKSQYPLRGFRKHTAKEFNENQNKTGSFKGNLDHMEEVKRCKALLKAANEGNMGEARALLSNTDPNWACDDSKFAIIEAAREGHLDMVRLLLDNGADANLYLGELYTPLMAAASEGHLEIVKLLIERGARAKLSLPNGTTALDVATQGKHSDVTEFLRRQMSE
ncbi:MAG: hypothetical protein DHS20C18_12600 [Saprospiraceae bacterium]|nr:MAG: hypothetical protein DHS20C18_12600 [Saprospiraceae bacterium]